MGYILVGGIPTRLKKYGSQLGLLFPSLARWWFHDHAMTKQFAQNLVAIGSTSRQSGLGGLSSIPASKQLSNTCGAIGILQIWGKLQQFANSKQRHHKKKVKSLWAAFTQTSFFQITILHSGHSWWYPYAPLESHFSPGGYEVWLHPSGEHVAYTTTPPRKMMH